MRIIKLIWDFRGLYSQKTAEHHEIHLKDFLKAQDFGKVKTGFEIQNELHSIAYLIVAETYMLLIRDLLKPHRAVVFEGILT